MAEEKFTKEVWNKKKRAKRRWRITYELVEGAPVKKAAKREAGSGEGTPRGKKAAGGKRSAQVAVLAVALPKRKGRKARSKKEDRQQSLF